MVLRFLENHSSQEGQTGGWKFSSELLLTFWKGLTRDTGKIKPDQVVLEYASYSMQIYELVST